MKLFRLYGSQDYRSLYYKNRDFGKKYVGKFIGTAFYDEWEKCEAEVRFKGKWGDKEIDIMDFGGLMGVALNHKAKSKLEDLILPYSELLPLELMGEELYLLNPIIVLDCLDLKKCQTKKISPLYDEKITKYVFERGRNYPSIFRIKNEPRKYIVTEEFAKRLEENTLVGYVLNELWDSEDVG